jgi:hypothetical protein
VVVLAVAWHESRRQKRLNEMLGGPLAAPIPEK